MVLGADAVIHATIRRNGVWLWAGRFGLLLRTHAAHPPLFSERHARGGCWSRRVGPLRLTLRWPVRTPAP